MTFAPTSARTANVRCAGRPTIAWIATGGISEITVVGAFTARLLLRAS
jgi:hypothetical protein